MCSLPVCLTPYTEISNQQCSPPVAGSSYRQCQRQCPGQSTTCLTCSPWRYGSTCQFICPGTPNPGFGPAPCNGHGSCAAGVTGNGSCICNSAYAGSACETCGSGH